MVIRAGRVETPSTEACTLLTGAPRILTNMERIQGVEKKLETDLNGQEVCMIATGLGQCQFHVVAVEVSPLGNIVIPIGGVHLTGLHELRYLTDEIRKLDEGVFDYDPDNGLKSTNLLALKEMMSTAQMLVWALGIPFSRVRVYTMVNCCHNFTTTRIPDYKSYDLDSAQQLMCLVPRRICERIHAMCAFRPAMHSKDDVDSHIMQNLAQFSDNPASLLYSVRFASWNAPQKTIEEDGKVLADWYRSPFPSSDDRFDWDAWSMWGKAENIKRLYTKQEEESTHRCASQISCNQTRQFAFETLCGRPFDVLSEDKYNTELDYQWRILNLK